MASCTVPSLLPGRPQRCPHPPQGSPRRPLQLAGTDLQNRVAEPAQERRALLLLLPFPLLRLYREFHDQRTLRAHVRDDEWTYLALGAEAMGMEGRRLQQAAQSIVVGEHERRLMLRGRNEGEINQLKKAEIACENLQPEEPALRLSASRGATLQTTAGTPALRSRRMRPRGDVGSHAGCSADRVPTASHKRPGRDSH